MSIIPSSLWFAHDPWELMRPSRRLGEYFGMGVTPPEIELFSEIPTIRRKGLSALKKCCGNAVPHVGKDGFQVSLDVQLFKPSEITVKTIDNTVIIEGKHEERQDDHGHISRHFIRKYDLPAGYESKDVNSTLSSDGYLTIKAQPPSKELLAGRERQIQIQHTGPAHLHVKEHAAIEKKDEQKDGFVDPTTNG